eukprot:scaffold171698_cov19-Tisochrysis_lutea.AAC.2
MHGQTSNSTKQARATQAQGKQGQKLDLSASWSATSSLSHSSIQRRPDARCKKTEHKYAWLDRAEGGTGHRMESCRLILSNTQRRPDASRQSMSMPGGTKLRVALSANRKLAGGNTQCRPGASRLAMTTFQARSKQDGSNNTQCRPKASKVVATVSAGQKQAGW